MRLLVTGAGGMLGRACLEALAAAHETAGADLADGDLSEPGVAAALLARHRPEWVVHTAAYTDVDGAERERERALSVNAGATAHLARACRAAGAGLLYVSTDYVFDGSAPAGWDEDDPRRPLNHYGASKAQGEEAVAAEAGPWQIVRTSWLFGPGPRNFVLAILEGLRRQPRLQVVDDQRGCPTYAPDLAEVLRFLVERRAEGVFHATNAGACTWFEFAREIARRQRLDPERIRPCATAEHPRPAARPACSVLRSRRLEALGCPPRPPWQDALARYLRQLPAP